MCEIFDHFPADWQADEMVESSFVLCLRRGTACHDGCDERGLRMRAEG